MSSLNFVITNQLLVEAAQPFVVASSVDYLSAAFEFSSEWKNCTNTAIFKDAFGDVFSVLLDESNSCTVPWEVIKCPYFTVSVFGICNSQRITTNEVFVKVERCGYAKGQTPEDPTPTVYETIINALEEATGGEGGGTGLSAYEVAVKNGFEGTEQEWLDSLKGEPGIQGEPGDTGLSAYEVALENGFEGTEQEWLDSLKGEPGSQGEPGDTGLSAYEVAVKNDFEGTEQEWLDSLKGEPGIQGEPGDTGLSAYEVALENGFEGTEQEWLDSLKGEPGRQEEEKDPVFTASAAYNIKSTDIDNWNNKSDFSGNYSDLTDKPNIPSSLSDLTGVLPIENGGTAATTASEALINLGINDAINNAINNNSIFEKNVIAGDGEAKKEHTLPFSPSFVFVFLRNSPFIEYDAENNYTKVHSGIVGKQIGGTYGVSLSGNILTLKQTVGEIYNNRFLNLNGQGKQYCYIAFK